MSDETERLDSPADGTRPLATPPPRAGWGDTLAGSGLFISGAIALLAAIALALVVPQLGGRPAPSGSPSPSPASSASPSPTLRTVAPTSAAPTTAAPTTAAPTTAAPSTPPPSAAPATPRPPTPSATTR